MNARGQVIFYTLMISTVIIVLALAFAAPVKQAVDAARSNSTADSVGLDCANSSISDYQKATCVTTDLTLPYFILGLIGIAGIAFGAKVIFGGN
jgi:hypothetical protein